MRYVIVVECDNPLVDMAVENAVDALRQEVEPYEGTVTVTHNDGEHDAGSR